MINNVSVLFTTCFFASVLSAPNLLEFDIFNENNSSIFVDSLNNVNNINEERNGRVLNFFPIPVEEECKSNDGRRLGICMNVYECKMQGGTSKGACALGFGACCVFTATCGQDVFNNITYFVNPDFPDLSRGTSECAIKIKKMDPEIAQIRLDFIHFNLGQPNRQTGVCEEDSFSVSGGYTNGLTMCGTNSGQHVYFDVDNMNEAINIKMNMSKRTVNRLWEIRIVQIPFQQRAPSGCMQYHTGRRGVIQTMNYADNGRHLANQDYSICTRTEQGMCSIVYEPCDKNSFRIGPNSGSINDNVAAESIQPPTQTLLQPPSQPSSQSAPQPPAQGINNANDQIGAENSANIGDEGSGDDVPNDEVNFNSPANSRAVEMCVDKIVLPCDSEDFLMPVSSSMHDYCTLSHCGNSLCPDNQSPCKLESSVSPFTIGVHFGPSSRDDSPDNNLGMCLTYSQQPCVV